MSLQNDLFVHAEFNDVLREAIHASPSLVLVLVSFGGIGAIPFVDAARFAGFANQTARNLLSENKFPIPTFMRNGRRFIHATILSAYMDGYLSTETNSIVNQTEVVKDESAKKRGRPTKASVLSRLANVTSK